MNSIAGVNLIAASGVACRVYVAAASFASNFAVAPSTALDGSAAAVTVEVEQRPFTVRIPFCPEDVLRSIIAAVNAALAAGDAFTVVLHSHSFPVNHLCVPSGAQWFQYDETSRGTTIKNVTFSFTAIADA